MKQMLFLDNKLLRLSSVTVIGILLWFFVYAITPASPTIAISSYTISYILLCYCCYFLGYWLSLRKSQTHSAANFINETHIKRVILLVFISWVFRYIDLFLFRDLSFFNEVVDNRRLLSSAKNRILFIPFSILKEAYFLPLLLTLLYAKSSRKLLVFSGLLFFLPLIEPFLRGTRKDILLLVVYLIGVLLVTKTIRINKKTVLKLFLGVVLLNVLFFQMLMKREKSKMNSDNVVVDIVEKARYNELLTPNESIKEEIISSPGIKRSILFNYLHTTQYYTHGIFELDYLLKAKRKQPEQLYGAYTFYNFPRFTNLLGLSDYDVNSIRNASPRSYTYITFFGGLYIDFAWFALVFMLVLGLLQKKIDVMLNQGKKYMLYFYLFFFIFNILMPVINIIRGSGLYTLFSGLILLLLIFQINKKNEKGLGA